jgi:hypothetical protein
MEGEVQDTHPHRHKPASVLGCAIAWVAEGRALLDLRPAEAYEIAHLKGSSSLPYPLLLPRSACPPPPLSPTTLGCATCGLTPNLSV